MEYSTKLNADVLLRLTELFVLQHWDIKHDKLFERFCGMMLNLGNDERDLILELTRTFLRVGLPDYMNLLTKALTNVPSTALADVKNLYFMPLASPKDVGKSKSGTFVTYMVQSRELMDLDIFSGRNIEVVNTPDGLVEKPIAKQAKVILVDDFLGSGETARSALEWLIGQYKVDPKTIMVVCLVAQQQAINVVKGIGIEIFCAVVRKKGITDCYKSPQKEQYTAIMQSIEKFLNPPPDFRFGYNRSEALVAMQRTPNNTFPVFWYEPLLRSGLKVVAPFPRYNPK
jgi:hypoxanthine phosphoribosyltransferase